MSASLPAPEPSLIDALAEMLPRLHAWAHLRVRGPLRQRLEPADLVQEVAMRVCQRRASYDPERGGFPAFVFGFANRVWLETLRELARDPAGAKRRVGGDSQLDAVIASVTSITQRLDRDEGFAAALRRIEALDDQDRQLVSCLALERLSHGEAATVLGIGADACRKRWQRLRERLCADALLAPWVAHG